MAEKIKLVQGDTAPQIKLTLTNEVTGAAINLTGATVTLHFRAVGSTTVTFSKQALVNPETASTGVCVVVWNAGDLNVDSGDYEGEVEVVLADGARETIFELLKFKVREDFA